MIIIVIFSHQHCNQAAKFQIPFLQKGHILITGLPESGWSESDIITLVQPFGTPSDITMATQVGKVKTCETVSVHRR